MSRIGKKPINIPTGVEIAVKGNLIEVKGPKGALKQVIPDGVKVVKDKTHVTCSIAETREKKLKSLFGLTRSLIANMVTGVTQGFSKELYVVGVGYKVKPEGQKVTFNI